MPTTTAQFINPLALSSLDGIIGVTFNGIAAGDQSGYSVAFAGDVNGDGFDDLVIGAPYVSLRGYYSVGSTYLVFGHRGTWNSSFILSSLNGTNGVVINGIGGQNSGYSVAFAGDINGDGIDDLVIGAPNASPGGISYAGSTYLIFGHRGAWDSPLALSSLNGTNGIVINGVTTWSQSGWSVASAGDVNGDGIGDLVIGANRALSYFIFGHADVWSSPLVLSSLNATNGVVINNQTGISVASAGDVNGDGISDVLISSGQSVYLIFGHTGIWNSSLVLSSLNGTNGVVINAGVVGLVVGAVSSAGDVNGDGISDLLIGASNAYPGTLTSAGSTYLVFGHTGIWDTPFNLSSLNGTNGVIINGLAAGDNSGFSVAGAGDVNGDGIDDILMSAYLRSVGYLAQVGSTYLIFGHTGAWNSSLVLSSLNGVNGIAINGVAANDKSGCSVAGAGDVNGDGLKDLVIGAYQASPGGISATGAAYLIFGDSLELLMNTLTINQGEMIFLNNSMLAAYHPRNLAINASIPFSITNVKHGAFSILNFLQSALSEQLVSFTHDGSIYAPSFEVTAGNSAVAGPAVATIDFDAFPIINLSAFSVAQGQTVVLTNQSISATSLYYPTDALKFNVRNVLHGNFVKTNTTTIENQFSQSALTLGQIAFMTDGSANTPSYDISVSDGRITAPAIRGTVNFNAAPMLLNNQLTLRVGQQKMLLSSDDLSASDTGIPAGELIFTPFTLNCHFENIGLAGTVLPSFLQKDIQNNQILFIWDGHTTPAYNMSVNDSTLSTGRPASVTIIPASNITSTVSTETTNTNAIVGGVVAAATLGLMFFGAQWYLRKRTSQQLQKILLDGIPDAEKTFNIDEVRPIANKIFDVINTTGCFGQRTKVVTNEYMVAIGKIVSELKLQNANLNFDAMAPIDKESFINEIANQTRQQSLPKHEGFSFGSCARYFKAEVTPQEIEYAAEGIALASVVWQRGHMNGVSAKNTSLGLELGRLSDIGFPGELTNEDIPPEKQFQWMQNHMKAMEQRVQEQQQERKRLEERSVLQKAELATFRSQI